MYTSKVPSVITVTQLVKSPSEVMVCGHVFGI